MNKSMITRMCKHCSTKNRSKARFCRQCGKQFPEGVEIFFSYAHEDELLRDKLAKHLSLLQRQGFVTIWHDRDISAGSDWSNNIDQHLQTSEIILLLVSANFIASDYCYSIEMQRAMDRIDREEVIVIPIILRPVDWKSAPFGKLQALPKDAKPIVNWSNVDQALLNTTEGIRRVIKDNYIP
jgi:hypothetical protein